LQQWQSTQVADDGPSVSVVPGDAPALHRVWPATSQDEMRACRRCRSFTEDEFGPSSGHTYPVRDCPDHGSREVPAPVKVRRLQSYSDYNPTSAYVTVADGGHAYLWDSSPEHATASGWGH
jgi:hypothetical protein